MATAMKSVHIDDQSTWRGGQQQVYYLLKGLNDRSLPAELITQPASVLGERARANGVVVHEVRMRGEADVFAARRISSIVRSGGFDVVHMHASHAHMLGCMACAMNPEPVCIVSRRVDFPVKKHALSLSRMKYRFRVDHYIAISKAVKEVLIEGGVDPNRISIVHSGVEVRRDDRPAPDIRAEFHLPPAARIIGTVGALVGHKGHRYLIEAAPAIMQKVPDATFVLVGDGELRTDLERLASRYGVENAIIFSGYRPDAHALLDQFDIFAAPSHMEGLNTSILDAMMLRRPVVATTAGGIPEIIEHEKTGLLVPPRDPGALAEAIVDLLSDPEKAETLALAGHRKAIEEFTAERMVEGTIAVYEKLLRERCKN